MRYDLPPLKGLRAVEAVGRHGSVSAAADELCVTPGAVSRQVAIVEAYFDCSLFIRERGGMTLTDLGKFYLSEIGSAFQIISTASAKTKRQHFNNTLNIRALGAFTSEWLLHNISDFEQQFPDIRISIKGHKTPVNFDTDIADIGIILGKGEWTGLDSEFLYTPMITAVASAEYLSRNKFDDNSKINELRLIQPLDIAIAWRDWLGAVAPEVELDDPKAFWLQTSSQAYTAVRNHLGIGLVQWHLVASRLANGSLVAPIRYLVPLPISVYMVWPRKNAASKPAVLKFRDWLVAKMDELEESLDPLQEKMTVKKANIWAIDHERLDYAKISKVGDSADLMKI